MKKKLLIMLLGIGVIFVGCSKDTVTDPNDDIINSSTEITVGGTQYTCEASALLGNGDIAIAIGFAEDENMSILLENNENIVPAVGNFAVPTEFSAWFTSSDTAFYFMNSGSVQITELGNSKISGSMNMSGINYYDSTQVISISGSFSGMLVEK